MNTVDLSRLRGRIDSDGRDVNIVAPAAVVPLLAPNRPPTPEGMSLERENAILRTEVEQLRQSNFMLNAACSAITEVACAMIRKHWDADEGVIAGDEATRVKGAQILLKKNDADGSIRVVLTARAPDPVTFQR